jgi:hypothetical protein
MFITLIFNFAIYSKIASARIRASEWVSEREKNKTSERKKRRSKNTIKRVGYLFDS